MTTEIGIINKLGIALAADSAVTATFEESRKIFNTANKLFSLSKYEPVGIMIYGGASLMDIPWETIIKIYRESLENNSFNTLEEYCNDFFKTIPFIVTGDISYQYGYNKIFYLFSDLKEKIIEKAKEFFENQENVDETTVNQLVESELLTYYEKCESLKFISSFEQDFIDKVEELYSSDIEVILSEIFQNVLTNQSLIIKLKQLGVWFLLKERFFVGRSGVVIAGFGKKDIFPTLYSYDVECIVLNKSIFKLNEEKSCKDKGVAIIPFAQDDDIATFINGAHPSLLNAIITAFFDILKEYPNILKEKQIEFSYKEEDLNKINQTLIEECAQGIKQLINENHVKPIITVLEALPKEQLAEMAETLVNLTSFKKRVSTVDETVGGPVDVAVITKGDGFIWVKRKHYFNAELNHHFFSNYFKKGELYDGKK